MKPIGDRFWPKVDKSGECWLWTGFTDKAGYGRLQLGRRSGSVGYAHRISLELAGQALPSGMVIDHLCRNRACVRPEHLDVVTNRENIMRGVAPRIQVHASGRCERGHDASEAYRRKSDGSVVYCRACRRDKRKGVSAPGN